ncbi:uncharacterized protein LOC144579746 isoform X2 [Callithrix jacchus]
MQQPENCGEGRRQTPFCLAPAATSSQRFQKRRDCRLPASVEVWDPLAGRDSRARVQFTTAPLFAPLLLHHVPVVVLTRGCTWKSEDEA